MNQPVAMGEFLRKRRASLSPGDVGLMDYGTRRVPGLRREEVAMMAGMSVTYYARLEQGQHLNASDAVINSLSRALALTDVERKHLADLSGIRRRNAKPSRSRPDHVRPGTKRLIESMHPVPAVVLGKRTEVLAWNAAGHGLVAPHLDFESPETPTQRPNMTRMLFLDEATRNLYAHWRTEAGRAVASLRLLSGRFADDAELAALVGELTLKSPEFAVMWAEHPVENCMSGSKTLHHPALGPLELGFEVLTMPDDSGHRILTYTAEPGSAEARALARLTDERTVLTL
ncbi:MULTISPECIES: helix-turn-helix transcriptional regulator [unclassified Arthrobacter]|uniref:helix-turn-helix transcriptional regulator n=1 Tax=unclassified Arthrobacter TaxID=235627 RepID=UPI001CFFABAF|nr:MULTISPECIES: helix-turn-helix transcriptional regulator [unclassified Arthrobacter]WGZ79652.1 helix-turn-helix transcriptional regulator [Arthrobacter sp. EM1]